MEINEERLVQVEAGLIEQDHRLIYILRTLSKRKQLYPLPNDPRRLASWKALINWVFSPAFVFKVIAFGGAVVTLWLTFGQLQSLNQSNFDERVERHISKVNEYAEAAVLAFTSESGFKIIRYFGILEDSTDDFEFTPDIRTTLMQISFYNESMHTHLLYLRSLTESSYFKKRNRQLDCLYTRQISSFVTSASPEVRLYYWQSPRDYQFEVEPPIDWNLMLDSTERNQAVAEEIIEALESDKLCAKSSRYHPDNLN